MKHLLPLLLFVSLQAAAGAHYIYPLHNGSVTISSNSTTPALAGGDTLVITGQFTNIQFQSIDGAGTDIYIEGRGATVSAANFQQPSFANLHYVVIHGISWINFYGTIRYSTLIDHLKHDSCTFKNTVTYRDQPIWQWDDQYASPSMVFTGSLSQTFHHNTYYLCEVNGYINATPVIFSSTWNGNGTDKRSLFNDGMIDSCIFKNITNTNGTGINVIAGTGFKMTVKRCRFDTITNIVSGGGGAHIADVLWYGSIEMYDNRTSVQYAALGRITPLSWNGLPGYLGNGTSSKVWNNIVRDQQSYSAFEFNQNNLGNRTAANGIYPTKWFCESNTVFGTVRHSYNGDYFGYVVDVANADSGTILNNFIMLPEKDKPFDLAARGYIWSRVSSVPAQQTVSNNLVAQVYNTAFIEDSINYLPSAGSPLRDAGAPSSFRTTDINGNLIEGFPDVGAMERHSSGIPPVSVPGADQYILLPTNSITLNGAGSTGTIASYLWEKVSGPGGGITNPNSATTTVTALTVGRYEYQLTVTGSGGTSSSKMKLYVNAAPVANAGSNTAITLPTNSVTLDGGGSMDDDGIKTYTWSLVSGPSSVTIASAKTPTVTNLIQGTYTFKLVVTDWASVNSSNNSTVTVTVNPAANTAPVANAGNDIPAAPGSVTLDGSGSTGSISEYYWYYISGPAGSSFNNSFLQKPTVSGLIVGTYIFGLQVKGTGFPNSYDAVTVTVTASGLRTATPVVSLPAITTGAEVPAGKLSLYPNPVRNTAVIELVSADNSSKTIHLYNATGVLKATYTWQTIKGKNVFSLKNIPGLGNGLYIVDVRDTGGKTVGHLKFIKL